MNHVVRKDYCTTLDGTALIYVLIKINSIRHTICNTKNAKDT